MTIQMRQEQLILGTLLGDGSAKILRNRQTRHPTSARLSIQHSTKRQEAYCRWKWHQLRTICQVHPKKRLTPTAFGKEIVRFTTTAHPFILEQALRLYTPTKTVTREYLNQLDDFGLAVWWMDDGSTAMLSTHSFTYSEQEIVQRYLLERWNVETDIKQHKGRQMWYIHFLHPKQIHEIVMPHVIPSLQYKFGAYQDANGQRTERQLQAV